MTRLRDLAQDEHKMRNRREKVVGLSWLEQMFLLSKEERRGGEKS